MLSPADNTHVITVGASDHKQSSESLKLGKPEIIAPSKMTFLGPEKKTNISGSSTASAVVAAVGTILLTHSAQIDKQSFVKKLTGNFNSPYSSKWFMAPNYQEIVLNETNTTQNPN